MRTNVSSGAGSGTATGSTRRSPAAWATTASAWSDDNGHPSVHVDHLAVHVVGSVRGQPDRGPDEVGRRSPACRRGAADDPGVERLVVDQVLGHLGVDVAGGQ